MPVKRCKTFIAIDSNITEDDFVNSENTETSLKCDLTFSHELLNASCTDLWIESYCLIAILNTGLFGQLKCENIQRINTYTSASAVNNKKRKSAQILPESVHIWPCVWAAQEIMSFGRTGPYPSLLCFP